MEVSHGPIYTSVTCFLWIWVLYVSLGRWQEISKNGTNFWTFLFYIQLCMCVHFTSFFFFLYKGGRTRALRYACKTDQDDFADWIYFLPSNLMEKTSVVARCSGYHYCTTSFNKAWTQVLYMFKSCSQRVRDSRWWGSLTMVSARNKAKRF